jgi:putative ABC transport system permease protein
VGKSIHVDGKPVTVAGVAPKFFDPFGANDQLWAPIAFTPQQLAEHDSHFLLVVGRLKDGISQQQAQSQLDVVAQHQQQLYPVDDAERGITLMSLTEALVGDVRPALLMLLGAVGLVLLIGCANVANLQLARARGRARELAIRRALGASDWRIARQILSESFILSVMGTVAGLVLANWSTRWLMSASPEDIPRIENAHLDAATLGFTVVLTFLSALLFGLAPAMRARSANLVEVFKQQARGITAATGRDRVRNLIVISQIALALMLLVGAGLLIRSAFLVQQVQLGFDPRGVLVGRVALPASQFRDSDSLRRGFESIVERAKAIPGVQSAAVVSRAPMRGGSSNGMVPEGRALDPRNAIDSRLRVVTPEYFSVTRIALKKGRLFTDSDQRGGPMVMVINETLAKAAFGTQDPIGKRFACCESGADHKPIWHEVIGVVSDVHAWGLERNIIPEFYLPVRQVPPSSWDWLQNSMDVVLRTDGNPSALVSDLRRTVADIAPDVPVYEVSTMSGAIVRSQQQARFNTFLLTLFASIALVLAAIGIYGVLAYSVAQRIHEIGIRMALGATRQNVLRLVLRGGLRITLIGLALGGVGAAIATRLLVRFLFQVKPLDVWSFTASVLILLSVSLLAGYLPARRATRVDPMVALRYE